MKTYSKIKCKLKSKNGFKNKWKITNHLIQKIRHYKKLIIKMKNKKAYRKYLIMIHRMKCPF
jgi:hypothetical protein